MAKRERGANFSIREIDLLADLVLKYADIIESKKTDAVTWREKEKQWETISHEFNAAGFVRSAKNLRSKYECLKKKMRKDAADRKLQLYTTGGGPPPKIKELEPWEAKLAPLLSLSVSGLEPVFDSDDVGVEIEILEDTVPLDGGVILVDSCLPSTSSVVPSEPVKEWTAFSPHNLRAPIHPALKVQPDKEIEEPSDTVTPPLAPSGYRKKNLSRRKKTQSLKSSHRSLLQAKLDLILLQEKILKQQNRRHLAEHKMKMRLLRLRYMAAKKRLV